MLSMTQSSAAEISKERAIGKERGRKEEKKKGKANEIPPIHPSLSLNAVGLPENQGRFQSCTSALR